MHAKNELIQLKQYIFSFSYVDSWNRKSTFSFYLHCPPLSTDHEQCLRLVLEKFPNSETNGAWLPEFLNTDFSNIPEPILRYAANAYDQNGMTVLGVACRKGAFDSIKKLIQFGAQVNQINDRDNEGSTERWGKSALHNAVDPIEKNEDYLGILRYLIDQGASIYQPTAMYKLCPYGYARYINAKQAYEFLVTPFNQDHQKKQDIINDALGQALFGTMFPIETLRLIVSNLKQKEIVPLKLLNKKTYNASVSSLSLFFTHDSYTSNRLMFCYQNIISSLHAIKELCSQKQGLSDAYTSKMQVVFFIKNSLLIIMLKEYLHIIDQFLNLKSEAKALRLLEERYTYSDHEYDDFIEHLYTNMSSTELNLATYIQTQLIDPIWNFHYRTILNPEISHLKNNPRENYTNITMKLALELTVDEHAALKLSPHMALPNPDQASCNVKMVHNLLNPQKADDNTTMLRALMLESLAKVYLFEWLPEAITQMITGLLNAPSVAALSITCKKYHQFTFFTPNKVLNTAPSPYSGLTYNII